MATPSNPIFIDVAASTPTAVKQEQEDTPDGGVKRHKCGMCDYSTPHTTLFNEHNNRHKGVKPYKCSLCPYHSVSKQYLKVHEHRHAAAAAGPPRPARPTRRARAEGGGGGEVGECSMCGKRFGKRWLISHLSNKQTCPQCGYTSCSVLMKAHLVAEHGAIPPMPVTPVTPVTPVMTIRRDKFVCALCPFSSNSNHRILLHLIHHPQPAACVDVSVLLECGILPADTGTA